MEERDRKGLRRDSKESPVPKCGSYFAWKSPHQSSALVLGKRDSILVEASISKTTSWGAWRRHSPSVEVLDFQLAQEAQVLVVSTVVMMCFSYVGMMVQILGHFGVSAELHVFILRHCGAQERAKKEKTPKGLGRIILSPHPSAAQGVEQAAG